MQTNDGSERKKIFMMDGHPILRDGISLLINKELDLQVCGHSGNTADVFAAIEMDTPDIIVTEISIKGSDSLDLIRQVKALEFGPPILVLSGLEEALYAERALRAGAQGYVMKTEDFDTLMRAVRTVLSGEIYLSSNLTPILVKKLLNGTFNPSTSPYETLSNRELEVFQLIGQGLQTRDIASTLSLSPRTIQVHRDHIKKKLHLRNSVELHQAAFDMTNSVNALD
jgi:DNA-binding NarL/FixJ family response regulator